MFDRVQSIKSIVGNDNLIINGDVVVNDKILTTVSTQLLRKEFEILSQEAKEEMKVRVDECVQSLMEQVIKKKLEEKLTEFATPEIQFAYYSALKGYILSETQEQREMMVDSMIDRLQEGWNSTERMIIDSAIETLPKLTPITLSTLGLLQLRHQIISAPIGLMVDQFFTSLTPIAEKMANISILDMEYLKQERLILPISGSSLILPLEQQMLSNYDLFFRKPLPAGVYERYCEEHPEAHESVMDEPNRTCMLWVDETRNSQTAFCCPNSRLLKNKLETRHQDYIIPHVDALMRMMPPFSEEEVRQYFIRLSPAWESLFKLFSSNVLTQYTLSITGKYIGGKILAKASHGKPFPLSDYNQIDVL